MRQLQFMVKMFLVFISSAVWQLEPLKFIDFWRYSLPGIFYRSWPEVLDDMYIVYVCLLRMFKELSHKRFKIYTKGSWKENFSSDHLIKQRLLLKAKYNVISETPLISSPKNVSMALNIILYFQFFNKLNYNFVSTFINL